MVTISDADEDTSLPTSFNGDTANPAKSVVDRVENAANSGVDSIADGLKSFNHGTANTLNDTFDFASKTATAATDTAESLAASTTEAAYALKEEALRCAERAKDKADREAEEAVRVAHESVNKGKEKTQQTASEVSSFWESLSNLKKSAVGFAAGSSPVYAGMSRYTNQPTCVNLGVAYLAGMCASLTAIHGPRKAPRVFGSFCNRLGAAAIGGAAGSVVGACKGAVSGARKWGGIGWNEGFYGLQESGDETAGEGERQEA